MKVGMSLSGDLTKRLDALPHALSFKVQQDALVAGAEPIRAEAASLAPRDDGPGPHMADNIIIDRLTAGEVERGVDFKGHETVVEIGPTIKHFYGYFSEYGTSRQGARPWFRPAFDTKQGAAWNIISARLWEGIRKFAGSPSSVGTVGNRNL